MRAYKKIKLKVSYTPDKNTDSKAKVFDCVCELKVDVLRIGTEGLLPSVLEHWEKLTSNQQWDFLNQPLHLKGKLEILSAEHS